MNVKTYNNINLDYMDMMSDGDDSMKKIMLEMLFEELPMEIDKMKEHVVSNNMKELGEVSHKMKSTLAFVGNTAMTEANKSIEQIVKNGEGVNELGQLTDTLQQIYPLALAELKEVHADLA